MHDDAPDPFIPAETWEQSTAHSADAELEVMDAQLGVIAVHRRDGDIVATGGSNGWEPTTTIAKLLAMLRHPSRGSHSNCRCSPAPITDDPSDGEVQ